MASMDPVYEEKNGISKPLDEPYSSQVETGSSTPERTLHRQLKNRHIAMIRCSSSDCIFFFPFLFTRVLLV